MKHFLTYVKHSYSLILDAEYRTNTFLEQDIETYTVHTFAKYFDKPNIPSEVIAIQMLTSVKENSEIRKLHLQNIAEECLLIDGLKLNNRKWPSKTYFKDMGILALEHRAYIERPPELFYEKIANAFDKISYVINKTQS